MEIKLMDFFVVPKKQCIVHFYGRAERIVSGALRAQCKA